jgi:hypothetical protein
MIIFNKNTANVLPYDRKKYIEYLEDDYPQDSIWNGISFQLNETNNLEKFIKLYDPLFKNLILTLNNSAQWIINHDDIDLDWLPNRKNNLSLLRDLFMQNNIPDSYRGAIIIGKDGLLALSKELLSYPYAFFSGEKEGLLYKNIDISHSQLPIVIKITGHMCIDLLSTDKKILIKAAHVKSYELFNIKQNRGTVL